MPKHRINAEDPVARARALIDDAGGLGVVFLSCDGDGCTRKLNLPSHSLDTATVEEVLRNADWAWLGDHSVHVCPEHAKLLYTLTQKTP